MIDRLYSGDAAHRHLETLSLLDPEVCFLSLRHSRHVCSNIRQHVSVSLSASRPEAGGQWKRVFPS